MALRESFAWLTVARNVGVAYVRRASRRKHTAMAEFDENRSWPGTPLEPQRLSCEFEFHVPAIVQCLAAYRGSSKFLYGR
jgi:hypothetical protein